MTLCLPSTAAVHPPAPWTGKENEMEQKRKCAGEWQTKMSVFHKCSTYSSHSSPPLFSPLQMQEAGRSKPGTSPNKGQIVLAQAPGDLGHILSGGSVIMS